MERGDLEGSARAIQECINRIPGLESYARVAHLRWLRGDGHGSIAAMTGAIHAGDRRDPEPLAWALSRLAQLHLHQGDATRALAAAEAALACQSGYPPALLVRGRALLAVNLPDAALSVLQAAASATAPPEFQRWLADALQATGDASAAGAIENQIIAHGALHDGRTTALFLATRGVMPEMAVRLAREEIAQRGDVHSHDALAWALFRAGYLPEAQREATAALRENTRDARLLLHAGLIAAAHGEPAAWELLREARTRSASLTPGERALLADHLAPSSSRQPP
jgi:tetratricopeptide (TPR) repeat protein